MNHVAHQCICMQYILELSKHIDVDPRACVASFFTRIQVAEAEYKKSFDDELIAFRERVRKRAAEKLEAAMKEAEEEERQARLGPGGLDPVEVFESLPEVIFFFYYFNDIPRLKGVYLLMLIFLFQALKKCFEIQDIELLKKTVAEMPEDEAKHYIRRCIDSGLWVPEAKDKENETEEGVAETNDSKEVEID